MIFKQLILATLFVGTTIVNTPIMAMKNKHVDFGRFSGEYSMSCDCGDNHISIHHKKKLTPRKIMAYIIVLTALSFIIKGAGIKFVPEKTPMGLGQSLWKATNTVNDGLWKAITSLIVFLTSNKSDKIKNEHLNCVSKALQDVYQNDDPNKIKQQALAALEDLKIPKTKDTVVKMTNQIIDKICYLKWPNIKKCVEKCITEKVKEKFKATQMQDPCENKCIELITHEDITTLK